MKFRDQRIPLRRVSDRNRALWDARRMARRAIKKWYPEGFTLDGTVTII